MSNGDWKTEDKLKITAISENMCLISTYIVSVLSLFEFSYHIVVYMFFQFAQNRKWNAKTANASQKRHSVTRSTTAAIFPTSRPDATADPIYPWRIPEKYVTEPGIAWTVPMNWTVPVRTAGKIASVVESMCVDYKLKNNTHIVWKMEVDSVDKLRFC